MWLVIIEWDGQKPPTTYYNRLHSLGLNVRGTNGAMTTKDESPLARRTGDDPGAVILQEGAVLCASQSLARSIGLLAQANGAAFVRIAPTEETQALVATAEDEAAIQRLNKVYGRRGRPSDTFHDWVVTCLEEMRTFQVRNSKGVANCPNCKGMRIRTRKGRAVGYKRDYMSDDPFESWLRVHFAEGTFEDYMDTAEQMPPELGIIHIRIPKEAEAVQIIAQSERFLAALRELDIHKSWFALRGAFEALTYINPDERSRNRVKAATEALRMGADPTKVKLVEAMDKVDFLDTVSGIGRYDAASLFVQYEMK